MADVKVSATRNWSPRFFMKPKNGYYIPYLDFINLDLELREEALTKCLEMRIMQ